MLKNMTRVALLAIVSLLVAPSVQAQKKAFPFQKRIMSYNTHHCLGMDNRLDVKRVAEIIKAQYPDVVAIQELDSMAKRSHYIYELDEISKYTTYHATYAATIPLGSGKYGIGMLTREEPKSVKRIPLPGKEPRMLLVVELENFVMACTHLDLTENGRLESLPIIAKEAKKWKKPFVMAGDWNARPGSKTMNEIGKTFSIISALDKDTYDGKAPGACIDYIGLFKNGHKTQTLNYRVLNEPVASDHFPIVADVLFIK